MVTNRKKLWILLLSGALLFNACSTSTSPATSPIPLVGVSPLPSATDSGNASTVNDACAASAADTVPAPAIGKAAITGVLFTTTAQSPIPVTMFYLTPVPDMNALDLPVVVAGPDPARGDIEGLSDANGYFELTEVPPGDYYISVWAPYNWLIVYELGGQKVKNVHVEAGDRLALGCVAVAWP